MRRAAVPLYPLRFEPICKEKVWGGRRIEGVYGRPLAPGARVGESWEIADHGGDVSRVAEGPLAGRSLRELVAEDPERILGEALAARRFDRFPLLFKLLDASAHLSVQVHPPDGYAAGHERGEWGKTELWYVAAAERGAALLCGLRPGLGREELTRALAEGRVDGCLRRIAVKPGDALFVPAGMVHAVCAGVLLFEIEENSDVTYRLFDWGRAGRPLHLAKALEVVDFDLRLDPLVCARWEEGDGFRAAPLARCRHFAATVCEVRGR
ncbi:MAG TPA: class I mannose-6-phosphate isomerase, partial [bacterium]|nr:class I mannose-6-phosphate isomerase [bacterium]